MNEYLVPSSSSLDALRISCHLSLGNASLLVAVTLFNSVSALSSCFDDISHLKDSGSTLK